jgi:hypothetical protein
LEGVEIIHLQEVLLNVHYGHDALSRSRVYYWIAEVKRGRTDFSNHPSPGTPDEVMINAIANKHAKDPRQRGIAGRWVYKIFSQSLHANLLFVLFPE